MKLSDIPKILDLATKARSMGKNYIPLFSGDAGLGKSEVCQSWVKVQKESDPAFGFLDLRLAYLDSPDLIGLTKIVEIDNKLRTDNIVPSFWPTSGRGLILLEEPNKAHPSIMNALMQILTDRKVHNINIPDGWIIAACINPENGSYDVNNMDTALKNRFEIFEVKYDRDEFLSYAKENNWDTNLVSYINSGAWNFKPAEDIGDNGFYISPRTWSKVNNAYLAGVKEDEALHLETAMASLGKAEGTQLHKFLFEVRPLVAKDFVGKKAEKAFAKLQEYSHADHYRGDLIQVTIESVTKEFPGSVTKEVISRIASIIPADLAANLLVTALSNYNEAIAKGTVTGDKYTLKAFLAEFPDLKASLDARMKGAKNESASTEKTSK